MLSLSTFGLESTSTFGGVVSFGIVSLISLCFLLKKFPIKACFFGICFRHHFKQFKDN
ncbi:hypothetical protein Hanom_Chr15g01344741 [Helianthus anomalus]